MTLVLDTSALVEVERKNALVIEKLAQLAHTYPRQIAITFASYAEFYYGFLRKYPHRKEEALQELSKYKILHTTLESTREFAELKLALEKNGNMLSLFDLLIASVVVGNHMTLVTKDKKFQNVPGLKVILI